MKKGLFITFLALAALVALPFASMAAMTAVTNTELESVSGQSGIDIAFDVQATIGYLQYADVDAAAGATTSAMGAINIQNIAIPQISCDFSAPLTIDAIGGTAATGSAASYIQIGLPTISGAITIGAIRVAQATVAATSTTEASIGAITIGDLNLASTTLKIKGH